MIFKKGAVSLGAGDSFSAFYDEQRCRVVALKHIDGVIYRCEAGGKSEAIADGEQAWQIGDRLIVREGKNFLIIN